MTDRLTLGIKEAADAVGLSHWTLRKMISEGKLPAIRINRRVLIELVALERLIEQHRDARKPTR